MLGLRSNSVMVLSLCITLADSSVMEWVPPHSTASVCQSTKVSSNHYSSGEASKPGSAILQAGYPSAHGFRIDIALCRRRKLCSARQPLRNSNHVPARNNVTTRGELRVDAAFAMLSRARGVAVADTEAVAEWVREFSGSRAVVFSYDAVV